MATTDTALKHCKGCRSEINSEAKFCPHCGKKTRRKGILVWLVAIFCAFLVLGYIGDLIERSPVNASESNVTAEPKQESSQPEWEYRSEPDKMGRGTTEFASLDSINTVDFAFPYNGGSKATLTLRNSPKYGKDAILQVSKGQFLCDVEDCRVNIKVDDGALRRLDANDSADGSADVIFLPYSTLIRDIEKAKVLRIEANFFQDGSRVFEFHPQGLDIKKLVPAK